jgi:hypothetical protein
MKTKEWKWKPNENEKVNPNTHLRYPIQPVANKYLTASKDTVSMAPTYANWVSGIVH